jgi:hypothetical protein
VVGGGRQKIFQVLIRACLRARHLPSARRSFPSDVIPLDDAAPESLLEETEARGELPEGGGLPGRPRGQLRPAGRAAVHRQHDQQAAEVPGLEVHRGRHRLRRLRRLVRPRGAEDHLRLLGRRGRRPGRVRQGQGGRWLPGPLWSEPAPAAARHLAVLQGQFR